MRTDINGCSTTPNSSERYEQFYSVIARGYRIQYDYRTPQGKLFSCVARTLDEARQRRNKWLEELETEATEVIQSSE